MRILVLGVDTRSFLAVVRSLGRAGHEIYTAWVPADSPALSSRYIHKNLELIAYRHGDDAWMPAFQQLLQENLIELVIPCTDPKIIPLQALRDRIQTKAKFYVLPDDVYRTANDKVVMYRIAGELGIPLARGALVTSEEGLRDALQKLRGPWVFKPPRSYSEADSKNRKAVRKAYTEDKAIAMGRRFLRQGLFQIQENFIGTGAGTEVLCDRGEILLAFQHLRIHEPLHGGGSSYRRGIPLHSGMYEATRKILQRLDYTGVAMVEFKWNQSTGEWIFLEMNARFWGSLPLAVASGADFPRALVEFLMYGKRSFAYDIRRDLYARNIATDIDWMLSNIRADKNDPAISALPWRVVLKELLNIVRGKERWDSLALDDPVPFFRVAAALIEVKAAALARRISFSRPVLALTRSSRNRRVLAMLAGAKSIGFVCYGNICRSPFAEAYARKRIPGIAFFSAGLYADRDRPSPDIAIAAAGRFDVELSQHKSSQLTREATQAADVMFVFDRWNLKDFHFWFSDSKQKVFLLSDLSMAVNCGIDDPMDHDLEVFHETYRIIKHCIDAIPVSA